MCERWDGMSIPTVVTSRLRSISPVAGRLRLNRTPRSVSSLVVQSSHFTPIKLPFGRIDLHSKSRSLAIERMSIEHGEGGKDPVAELLEADFGSCANLKVAWL